jgi:hypothetical protein
MSPAKAGEAAIHAFIVMAGLRRIGVKIVE